MDLKLLLKKITNKNVLKIFIKISRKDLLLTVLSFIYH